MLIFAWIILSFVIGKFAENKGNNFWTWSILALILSPFIAWLIILVKKETNQEVTTSNNEFKNCLYCAETIKRQANKCKHCGADLPVINI